MKLFDVIMRPWYTSGKYSFKEYYWAMLLALSIPANYFVWLFWEVTYRIVSFLFLGLLFVCQKWSLIKVSIVDFIILKFQEPKCSCESCGVDFCFAQVCFTQVWHITTSMVGNFNLPTLELSFWESRRVKLASQPSILLHIEFVYGPPTSYLGVQCGSLGSSE
jgi:hypothetical protein